MWDNWVGEGTDALINIMVFGGFCDCIPYCYCPQNWVAVTVGYTTIQKISGFFLHCVNMLFLSLPRPPPKQKKWSVEEIIGKLDYHFQLPSNNCMIVLFWYVFYNLCVNKVQAEWLSCSTIYASLYIYIFFHIKLRFWLNKLSFLLLVMFK